MKEGTWREILDFERDAWRLTIPKARAIWETFGLTPALYYQRLEAVLDTPEALRYAPALVRRLRRLRVERRAARHAERIRLDSRR